MYIFQQKVPFSIIDIKNFLSEQHFSKHVTHLNNNRRGLAWTQSPSFECRQNFKDFSGSSASLPWLLKVRLDFFSWEIGGKVSAKASRNWYYYSYFTSRWGVWINRELCYEWIWIVSNTGWKRGNQPSRSCECNGSVLVINHPWVCGGTWG